MKKLICLVLSLVCIVSMVACGKSDESAPTAADENALNAEEQLLINGLINTFKPKEKFDMATLRVTEIGDYSDDTDSSVEERKGGISVIIKVEGKSKSDSTETLTAYYYFVIKGAYNKAHIEKYWSEHQTTFNNFTKGEYKPHNSPTTLYGGIYGTSLAHYWSTSGDFVTSNSRSITSTYNGIRIGKVNQALKEHYESLGLL